MIIFLVDKLFVVYTCMLFGRILGSWIPELQRTRFMQFIAFYTDPYLNLFRRIIPPLGMFDLSPIVAFLCLSVVEHVVKALLFSLIS
jgi:YggT family protein